MVTNKKFEKIVIDFICFFLFTELIITVYGVLIILSHVIIKSSITLFTNIYIIF